MQPLVDDMVQDEPEKRPTIDEVISRFDNNRASLQARKIRLRLGASQEDQVERLVKITKHALVRKVTRSLPGIHGGKAYHPHPQ